MKHSDSDCVHNLQLAQQHVSSTNSSPPISYLFCSDKPIWKQTCTCSRPRPPTQSLTLLFDLMNAAAGLTPTSDQAAIWLRELPRVTAQFCCEKDVNNCESIQRNGHALQVAKHRAAPYLREIRSREKKVQQMALLQGEDPLHLVLHLVDISLSQGILEADTVLDTICDTAAIVACGPWRTDTSGKMWLAIINIGGAIISRYTQNNGEHLALNAVELARITISIFALLPANAQHALLALVYVLNNSLNCNIDPCISDLVRHCNVQCNSPMKRAIGQLLLKLYENGGSVPSTITNNIWTLASDFDYTVRVIWIQLANRVAYRLYSPPTHPFAALQQSLHKDAGLDCHDHTEIIRGTSRMSLGDAMLVVQAVAECVSTDTSGHTLFDIGFGDRELSIIETIYRSSGLGDTPCSDVLLATNASIAAAARRIRAADSTQSCCLPLVTYLIDIVKSALAKRGDTNLGASMHGLYWILELIFHLCLPKTTATGILQDDVNVQLLLLSAARECCNIAFAVYICQNALYGDHQIVGSNTSHNTTVQRLVQAFPWPELDQILGADVGDAVDAMAGQYLEPVNSVHNSLAALSVVETDAVMNDASKRLRYFDNRLSASTGGCEDLRYASSLFDGLAVSKSSNGAAKVSAALLGWSASKMFISDRFLERRPLYTVQGLVTNKVPNLSEFPQPNMITKALQWKELTDSQRLACLEGCIGNGFVSSDAAISALQDICLERLIPQDTMRWRELATACVVARAYNLESLDISKNPSIAALFAKMSEFDSAGASFALPYLRMRDNADMNTLSGGICTEDLAYAGSDCMRAKEALLYHLSGTTNALDQYINELYTQVLMDGSGKIRFTGSGTFDPASRFISKMSVCPLHAPILQTLTLSARAIKQLAPYIPQLFAMLCFQNNSTTEASNLVSESAYKILKLLAESAPDIVIFYAVVASSSLAASFNGQSLIAKLLELFDVDIIADIRCFINGVTSVAVIPQEKLRWACTKAKLAHLKALSAYQRRKSKELVGSGDNASDDITKVATVAINESLQSAYQILDDYKTKELLSSQAEKDFVVCIVQLRALLDKLQFSDEFLTDNSRLEHIIDKIWSEIFAMLKVPETFPLEYGSPILANFSSAIPIPTLTHPTEPLYFCQAGDTARVIGSKTRPKLLVFHLCTRTGFAMQEKYILKGTEDLRIDESVMQMFIRLNRICTEPVVSASDLNFGIHDDALSKLAVYNVVPTGSYGGLIQVVDHAPSLFNIYTQHEVTMGTANSHTHPNSDGSAGSNSVGSKDGRADVDSTESKKLAPPILRQIFADHAQPILENAGLPGGLPLEKWPNDIINMVYDSISQTVPPDLLHKQLMQTAQNSAHLYLITKNMVRSIGMASIAGYILGLGDRHLDNLLVKLQSAQLVQIDFNVCYDFGGISNIPEQVPFRLTPILTYLCGTPDLLEDIHRSKSEGLEAVQQRPFSMSKVFLNAATATMQFARMDKEALVNGIMSRMHFWPFMEWSLLEKSWLQDCEHNQGNCFRRPDSLLLDRVPPKRLPAGSASLWNTPHAVSVEEFVQRTGLCPPNAFWPQEILSDGLALTEMPFGWRLARGAVNRIRARLDFRGIPEQTLEDSVRSQTMLLWEVATSKSKLARMYTGWAPWI